MNCPKCPHCSSLTTTQLARKTSLGYKVFRCKECHRIFNERTGTPFNSLVIPWSSQQISCSLLSYGGYNTSSVYATLLRCLWREVLSSSRKLYTIQAVRDWEARFAPLIIEQLRARRTGKASRSWYVDETYISVGGKWRYLYRAIDRDGNLVDSMLSKRRDMVAAKRFFKQAKEVTGCAPERVTTDGHHSYPRVLVL